MMKKLMIACFVCGFICTNAATANATNLTNLTDAVMNGWRVDYKRQMRDWKVPSSEKKAILEMLQAEKALKEKFADG